MRLWLRVLLAVLQNTNFVIVMCNIVINGTVLNKYLFMFDL